METGLQEGGPGTRSPSMDVRSRFGRLVFRRGSCGVVLVLLMAAVALGFRLQHLELRPFHGERGAEFVRQNAYRTDLKR